MFIELSMTLIWPFQRYKCQGQLYMTRKFQIAWNHSIIIYKTFLFDIIYVLNYSDYYIVWVMVFFCLYKLRYALIIVWNFLFRVDKNEGDTWVNMVSWLLLIWAYLAKQDVEFNRVAGKEINEWFYKIDTR